MKFGRDVSSPPAVTSDLTVTPIAGDDAETFASILLEGFGAAQGLTTAVVYGVLSLIACLPGAAVLLLSATRASRRVPAVAAAPMERSAA